ncbi:hypothetical protein JMJ56_06885 [Belnapia sp. T18]|uniref:Uncharacterized protein n=1 Tax=Belnapia arida TaxID=2804533 RepID=A0ABS1U0V5_9PROT|nr:hypothetical protein [Belnapia arida]MBL6077725.1 hypothetical protein [Belnapia arida]
MTDENDQPPRERAPLLLAFGEHAGRMAALIRVRPILIARLIVAPREAVHSIGAFLHLAPDACRPEAEVAGLINDSDPRDLLAAALPGSPSRLYRALDRVGDRVRGQEFYRRVGKVAAGPFADAMLEAKAIDDACLTYCEALSGMDPEVAAIFATLRDQYHAEFADSLVAFLRAYGAVGENDLRLPPRSGLPALVRRLTRALGQIPAPDPGFEVPAPYRLITSTDELQRLGREFQNCLALHHWGAAEHHLRLIDGSGVYLVADELRLLVALHRIGGGLWVLEQCAGPKNEAPPAGAQAALLKGLAANGVKVLATDPQTALARLYGATRRHRRLQADDLNDTEDGDGDDGEEIAA